jgi:hypothetical protein
VAAAHHRERIGVVEVGAAREQGHGLLAGVDQVFVFFSGRRCRPHAEQAVLAVQEHFALGRQEVGDFRRQADAEVDVGALGDVLRHARGHPVAAEFLRSGIHDAAHAASLTTR